MEHPINNVIWVSINSLKANNYNPNKQATPESKLLQQSILKDGFTQPIVVTEDMIIVDGFHRYSAAKTDAIIKLTNGMVPIVILQGKTNEELQQSTVRHNRARGVHGVLPMAEIVKNQIEKGVSLENIMQEFGMEKEEVYRLADSLGISKSKLVVDVEFTKSWVPLK
jgi:ParB-like chromosome segregation protein Spo0J